MWEILNFYYYWYNYSETFIHTQSKANIIKDYVNVIKNPQGLECKIKKSMNTKTKEIK